MNKKALEWQRKNPEKRKRAVLKYRYGLTPEQLETLRVEQNGLCAICKNRQASDVDHNHRTQKVRGLLCGDCNRGVGLFHEDSKRLRAAADYIDTHNGESYEDAIAQWKLTMKDGGWVGVDLDGTLAHYTSWAGPYHIGEPIPKMAHRVRAMLAANVDVRIFTARAADPDPAVIYAIQNWTEKHFGVRLPVTNVKDYNMVQAFDDRIIQVIPNTGERADGKDSL